MYYTIAVFNKNKEDVGELLAPYQDNNEGNCQKQFLQFVDCTQEVLEMYEKHRDDFANIDDFANKYYGYEQVNGKYGYFHNPNTKWDWYHKQSECSLKNLEYPIHEVITSDGVWHSNDTGWDYKSFHETFIKDIKANSKLIMIECHI